MKRFSLSPEAGAQQAKDYARQLHVPYVFLANGREIRLWEWEREAYAHPVKTFFKQADLERRFATRQLRQDPLAVPIDHRIAGRDFQKNCIDTLCRELEQGRRKLLVEMATGTGKTRLAAALIKRLFMANTITRVLFLVDRIPLAKQTEDAFDEHLPDYPCYVLRAGRRFQDEKQITITTLQSMINIYGDYSSGYFDLIITDECHRSIYGQWNGVLKHFGGIQLGLTATPCVAGEEFDDAEDTLFVRDTLRFFEVEQPTFTYKLEDVIRDGYLALYQIYKVRAIKMFGDPATNPKGWRTIKLGEVLVEPPTLGTMAKLSSNSGRWLDLRVANIQGGLLTLEDKKVINLPDHQINRFSLRDIDIVLAPAIGSLDHLGKPVVVYAWYE